MPPSIATMATATADPPTRHRVWGRVRSVLAGLLVTLGAILALVSVLAVWVNGLVRDTDRYVQTVAPLIDDPAVQAAVADAATEATLDTLDLQTRAANGADQLAQSLGLGPRISDLTETAATALAGAAEARVAGLIERAVASPQFATAWEEANRVAHDQVVGRITGERTGAVEVTDGVVSVDLQPLVAALRDRLVDRGVPGASAIPDVDRELVLVSSDALGTVQSVLSLLNAAAPWLPWITLALLLGAIALARRHHRMVIVAGLSVAGALVIGLVALAVVQDAAGGAQHYPDAAAAVVAQLVAVPRGALRGTALVALVIALVAALTQRGARAGFRNAAARLRGTLPVARGGLGRFVADNVRMLRAVVLVLGLLVLVFVDRPTPLIALAVVVGLVLLLALLEMLRAPDGEARTTVEATTVLPAAPAREPPPEG